MTPERKLAALRASLALSREAMAEKMGTKAYHLQNAERGNIKQARLVIPAAARAFGVPEAWFFDGQESPPPTIAAQRYIHQSPPVLMQVQETPAPSRPLPRLADLNLFQGRLAPNGDCLFNLASPDGQVPALPIDFPKPPSSYFWLRVLGSVLAPYASSMDLALGLVTPHTPMHSLVLAQLPSGQAVLRAVRPSPDPVLPYILEAVNPAIVAAEPELLPVIGAVHAIDRASVHPINGRVLWDPTGLPLRLPSPASSSPQ